MQSPCRPKAENSLPTGLRFVNSLPRCAPRLNNACTTDARRARVVAVVQPLLDNGRIVSHAVSAKGTSLPDLFTTQNLVALLTLTILEIVLGVDNIIFLAIVTQDVPKEKQVFIRRLGLSLALLGRIVMVLGISYLLQMDTELFTIAGHSFSAKDVILIGGGLFLTYKAVTEIYKTTELKEDEESQEARPTQEQHGGRSWCRSSSSTWSSRSTPF